MLVGFFLIAYQRRRKAMQVLQQSPSPSNGSSDEEQPGGKRDDDYPSYKWGSRELELATDSIRTNRSSEHSMSITTHSKARMPSRVGLSPYP